MILLTLKKTTTNIFVIGWFVSSFSSFVKKSAISVSFDFYNLARAFAFMFISKLHYLHLANNPDMLKIQ